MEVLQCRLAWSWDLNELQLPSEQELLQPSCAPESLHALAGSNDLGNCPDRWSPGKGASPWRGSNSLLPSD